MSFQSTFFKIVNNTQKKPFVYIGTYGANCVGWGGEECNTGIECVSSEPSSQLTGESILLTLKIDPVIVNNQQSSSDKASLIIHIDEIRYHIDIHKDGGMSSKGIYGEGFDISHSLKDVGQTSVITVND